MNATIMTNETIAFSTLPKTSKVWIYASDRNFNSVESVQIQTILQEFVSGWKSHGSSISGHFEVLFNRFIVLAIDDSGASASGCSIDSSVKIIRSIEEKFSISLTNRALVAYQKEMEILQIPFQKIKEAIQQGEIQADTIIFDNSVITLEDFHAKWRRKAKESWIARFFN